MGNTFVISRVLDFSVYKFATSGYGDLLFTADYAKTSTVATTGERLEISGGPNNYKIMDIDHTKRCTYNASLALVDVNALATKLGKAVTVGAKPAFKKEILTVNSSNQVTLAEEPLTGTLRIYKLVGERDPGVEQTLGTPASTESKYSISTKTITFNATSAPVNTKMLITYDYTSGVLAQNIKITANDFPGFITIAGRGLVDDDQDGKIVPVSFKIHKAKVQPGFELTMASASATELEFMTDCYTVLNSAGEREFVDIVKLNNEAY